MLSAIPSTSLRGHTRPRDFYDIHAIITVANVRLSNEQELIRRMFDAKAVPYRLISLVERDREREFHRQGWEAVVQAVRGEVRSFDFYFDFLRAVTGDLHPLWEEESPLG